MTPLYLITGFLGAGKTTFLQAFVQNFAGKKLAILVNEFGKTGVDGKILTGYANILREVAGGSIFCTCKLETFEEELLGILAQGPDVVLLEASGLADPTSIWKLLQTRPCFKGVDYRGCICLADAVSFPKVLRTARPCKKQLSVCDVLVLNKLDLATEEQKEASMAAILSQRPDVAMVQTTFGKLTDEQLQLCLAPKLTGAQLPAVITADVSLCSTSIEIAHMTNSAQLSKFLQMFCEDCYRIKGFLQLTDGAFLVNCVGAWIEIKPCEQNLVAENILVILHTSKQGTKKAMAEAQNWYPALATIL